MNHCNFMLTIDCKDVSSVQNELLVYVADKVEAIPTLKNHQFTLSTLDDDDVLEIESVISAIREYFDSINEGSNFAVISNNEFINITSINGKVLKNDILAQTIIVRLDDESILTYSMNELKEYLRLK